MRVISRRARPPVSSKGASSPIFVDQRRGQGSRDHLRQVADPGAKLIMLVGGHAGDTRAEFSPPTPEIRRLSRRKHSVRGAESRTTPLPEIDLHRQTSTPDCSFPAIGCPARNRRPAFLPKVAVARADNLGFGATHIGEQRLGGKRGPNALDQLDDRDDRRAASSDDLASSHRRRRGSLAPSSIAPSFSRPLQYRRAIAADDAARESSLLQRQPEASRRSGQFR